MVAAAGGRADVVGIAFPLTILQQWKQERLLENDAYMVRSYESTLRDPLALPIDDEGSVFVAPVVHAGGAARHHGGLDARRDAPVGR